VSDIKFERYKLVLHHDFVDGEEIHEIEKPLVIQCCFDRTYWANTVILNNMIDKLRDAVLNEEVYCKYYDTAGNLHWIGTLSGEHKVWLGPVS